MMQSLYSQLGDDRVDPALCSVIHSLADVSIDIAARINRGALAGILGSAMAENVQGETQKKLDVIANDLIKSTLVTNAWVRALASEEEESIVVANEAGQYLVAFDPLDGSSNIDVNAQIGTIFAIYPVRTDVPSFSESQFYQLGSAQVCAGYILYGASTLLVITTGAAARCYILDNSCNEFILAWAELKVPSATAEFSVNMSNQRFWGENFKAYIADLLQGEAGKRGKRFNMRWNAAMVGDVHRVLIRGGIFMYPSDSRNLQQPAKLRLLYEANPMAKLIEAAGGEAYTESEQILSIVPTSLHQRVAVILGSATEVNLCLAYLNHNNALPG
jgi:fructose-1,6-bisphosphatase I